MAVQLARHIGGNNLELPVPAPGAIGYSLDTAGSTRS
jgi:hypothetical protein